MQCLFFLSFTSQCELKIFLPFIPLISGNRLKMGASFNEGSLCEAFLEVLKLFEPFINKGLTQFIFLLAFCQFIVASIADGFTET